MKKTFIFFDNDKGDLYANSKAYLHAFKQRFFETPERSLNRAYSAALLIQSLEREHLQHRKAARSANHRRNIEISLQTNIKQLLNVVRLRLTEFKLSHLVLSYPGSNYLKRMELIEQHVEKLKLIDEVLDKYLPKRTLPSSFSLLQDQEIYSKKNAEHPYLTTMDVQASEVISHQR
jgi:hypothetical protein